MSAGKSMYQSSYFHHEMTDSGGLQDKLSSYGMPALLHREPGET